MPSRNVTKVYVPEAYYHVYNRGINKQRIFLETRDYAVFLNLLKRYLDEQPSKDKLGREYDWLHPELELLAFCLMPNHFHLLFYQHNQTSVAKLLSRVCTAYTMYFNKKYHRVGPLYQDTYRASHIYRDDYLQHISRYIHLNPGKTSYKKWEFSSLPYYLGNKNVGWVKPEKILELFSGAKEYKNFVGDYEDYKETLDKIRADLAN